MSKKVGDFTLHANIGYERRWADLDSDQLEFIVGFDQKIGDGRLVFAAEVMGAYDLNEDESIKLFPGSATTIDRFSNDLDSGQAERNIDLSNIPERRQR